MPPLRLTIAATLALAALPTLALAQEPKPEAQDQGKAAASNDHVEGLITKIEPLGEKGSDHYRLTINTGAVWRDYARDAVETEDDAQDETPRTSVAEGQPETESSLVHVEIDLETPIQRRYRTIDDSRSLGAASADGAARLSKEDIADAKPDDVPDGKQGQPLQPHFLKKGEFVVIKAKGRGDNPRVEWVIRLQPVLPTKDEG